MPSKFDEEIAAARDTGRNAILNLKYSIQANAPEWIVKPISAVLIDDRTPVFLLGMGFEALGIAIQNAIGFPAYPIIDAITALVLFGLLFWYQRRNHVH